MRLVLALTVAAVLALPACGAGHETGALEGTGGPLTCEVNALGIIDYVAEAPGYPTPMEAIRRQNESLIRPDDVVEQLGYLREATPSFALVRDGVAIAAFEVWSDDAGGWLVDSTSSCRPFGF